MSSDDGDKGLRDTGLIGNEEGSISGEGGGGGESTTTKEDLLNDDPDPIAMDEGEESRGEEMGLNQSKEGEEKVTGNEDSSISAQGKEQEEEEGPSKVPEAEEEEKDLNLDLNSDDNAQDSSNVVMEAGESNTANDDDNEEDGGDGGDPLNQNSCSSTADKEKEEGSNDSSSKISKSSLHPSSFDNENDNSNPGTINQDLNTLVDESKEEEGDTNDDKSRSSNVEEKSRDGLESRGGGGDGGDSNEGTKDEEDGENKDKDKEGGGDKGNNSDDQAEERPMLHIRMDGIFEEEDEDQDGMQISQDNDHDQDEPPDIQSMLHVSMHEHESDEEISGGMDTQNHHGGGGGDSDDDVKEVRANEGESSNTLTSPSGRPTRRAAAVAANTIREISSNEAGLPETWRRRKSRPDDDAPYALPPRSPPPPHSASGSSQPNESRVNRQFCNTCRKRAICEIKIQLRGNWLHFCSRPCYSKNRFGTIAKGRVPCTRCGTWSWDTITGKPLAKVYYWETLTFCSEVCVGKYQLEVGGKCSTCTNTVPWLSLGKYCVRFGSDIRQFCSAPCLDSYKKNARVCFHCQMDIKRLGNVILASLPGRQSPKEFCSQECVEMYVEQNLNQSLKSKSSQDCICMICGDKKECYRELIIHAPKTMSYKSCSEACFNKILESRYIMETAKCSTCPKYINADFAADSTLNYLADHEQVYGFCTQTCKNVFVLKNRKILSCITCKVKKYNYDLITFYQGSIYAYATCSLNCLPATAAYINRLRLNVSSHQPMTSNDQNGDDMDGFPIINSVSSYADPNNSYQVHNTDGSRRKENGLSTTSSRGKAKHANIAVGGNASDEGFEILEDWDGILRVEDIQAMMKYLEDPPEMVSKMTMVKPLTSTISTQTEESALEDMERVPLKTVEKKVYVPFAMPIPVYIPVPTYIMESPVPYMVPIPIPVPVPVPYPVPKEKYTTLLDKGNKEDVQPNDNDVEMVDLENQNEKAESPASNSNLMTIDDASNSNDGSEEQSSSRLEKQGSHDSESGERKELGGSESEGAKPRNTAVKRRLSRRNYGLKAFRSAFSSSIDPASLEPSALCEKLIEWIKTGKKPSGERYRADLFLYLCLGIQEHLKVNERSDSILYDPEYSSFVSAYTEYAESDSAQGIVGRIEDFQFWESQQLGDSSPGVLLFTLVYLLYRHFNLKTWENHAALQFSQIKLERKFDEASGSDRNYLRLVNVEDCAEIELMERHEDSERCPVRLIQLYTSKCTRPEGCFYKAIKSDVSSSDFDWYDEKGLDQIQIYRMLVRAMMIKSDDCDR